MPRKKTKNELEIAELRYRMFVEKRNDYNHKADAVIAEMETLRRQKNAMLEDLKAIKDEKSRLHDEIQSHKRRRDEFQKRAKELLGLRRNKKVKISASLERQLNDLDAKIKAMERRQETTFMSLKDENKLLDKLRINIKKRKELEQAVEEQKELLMEVENIDLTVEELFKIANDEHEEIVNLFPRVKELSAKMAEEFNKVGALIAELKKRRELFGALKKKADYYHQKVKDMREKIITIKKSSAKELDEARDIIKAQNIKVKKILGDEKKLKKKADEALLSLMKEGKIELK